MTTIVYPVMNIALIAMIPQNVQGALGMPRDRHMLEKWTNVIALTFSFHLMKTYFWSQIA